MSVALPRPVWWPQALQHLGEVAPVFVEIDRLATAAAWRAPGDAFTSLARAIVGQQISVKAASSVWQRLLTAVDPDGAGLLSPPAVLQLAAPDLRACGLSERKAEYVQALARHFSAPDFSAAALAQRDNAEVVAELTAIRGIGAWTAEMYLMFHLQRPDVLPVADLGVRAGAGSLFGQGGPMGAAELRRLAAPWTPFASAASWLLWRYLEYDPELRQQVRSVVASA